MKKNKSTITDPNEILKMLKPVNTEKWAKEAERRIKREQREWDRKNEIETKRLENLSCPCCNSKKKQHVVKSKNNGVIGPGFHSWVTDDYYVCLDCGVHYSDSNKSDIGKRPRGL